MLALILSGEFLLHIPSRLHFNRGSFSYTSLTGFIFFFFLGEFLLHIPRWLQLYLRRVSYTSHASFIFIWGVSLTHPMLALILSGEFLLHIPFWFHFETIEGAFLTHPVLPSSLCREFLWHILCCLHFYAGSFSYTSRAFFFIRGVSLTHPMLASFDVWSFSGLQSSLKLTPKEKSWVMMAQEISAKNRTLKREGNPRTTADPSPSENLTPPTKQ